MSIIQVTHIEGNCTARFSSLIKMDDCETMQPADKNLKFLSRAVAAFAIAALAKVDDSTAAAAVVDEYHDDGIDAFYYDRAEHTVYLAQTKWSANGSGSIDLGAMLKFTQGVNHFFEYKIDMLGAKMKAKGDDIRDALHDSQARYVLVVAYTGTQPLSAEVAQPINSLIENLNDDADSVSLQVLKQKELHRVVELGAMGSPIDFDIMLREWGKVSEPYTVYYGHIEVADLAPWAVFGDRIYTKNIRGFKGSTDVNDAIISTLNSSPEKFLYFNNGLTLLCESIDKKMLGGASRTNGVFECKGASVINGAQTVGSVLTWLSSNPPSSSINPQIFVRLISLKDCPVDFSVDVTRAANTQNTIQGRDFASQDTEQSRLRSELNLSLNKDYVYRTGEQPPSPEKGCTLEDATIALACSQPDLTHAVNAKQAIGRFFADITRPPYTILFNSSLTAEKMWCAVQVLRAVDETLKSEEKNLDGKHKLCVIHGNRVLLYLAFRDFGDTLSLATLPSCLAKIPVLMKVYTYKMEAEISINYSASYVGNIFKTSRSVRLSPLRSQRITTVNTKNEFSNFASMVSTVLSIPKTEILRREAEYESEAAKNPNRRGAKKKPKPSVASPGLVESPS